ncbi:MAG: DUF6261 family protein [Tannerellaceae bacterium]|jgi:hypothetical protein|nr:DUF6261 family protein [Tannerellaceae bacterium]
MTISRFAVPKLRNEEWFRFHTEVKELVLLYGAELLGSARLFVLYCTLYEEADHLLEVLRRSFTTAETSEADRKREAVFRSLRDVAKSFRRALDPAQQSAGEKVYAVVSKYSQAILRGSLASKTAAIDNLLQDLTTTSGGVDLTQEVQLLGVTVWVTNLDTVNTAYKQSLAERSDEEAARSDAGRMKQVRLDMDHYYVNIINTVDALLLGISGGSAGEAEEDEDEDDGPVEGRDALPETPDEKLLHFARALNVRIARYKALLKGRRTRRKKDPEDAGDAQ